MGAENPPPIAIITRLTLTPNMAIIPKARMILHFGTRYDGQQVSSI